MRGYLPLIQKDSSTRKHGLAVYVKEGLPFARDLSLENSADSYLCFRLALLHSVSYFFFLYLSPSSSLCMVFNSISSNIDEVLSFNPSVNAHHKDWLTYSGGTDRSGEVCYNFSISNDLTQIVNFSTRIPDCDSHSPALFGTKHQLRSTKSLNIVNNGIEIKQHAKVKYLGCILDESLFGESMALNVIDKINSCLQFLYREHHFLTSPLCRLSCNSLT